MNWLGVLVSVAVLCAAYTLIAGWFFEQLGADEEPVPVLGAMFWPITLVVVVAVAIFYYPFLWGRKLNSLPAKFQQWRKRNWV